MTPEAQEAVRKAKIVKPAQEAMQQLINSLNVMGYEQEIADAITQVLVTNHRTLQACTISVIKELLSQYAEAPYDLRNQAAVEYAQEVAKVNKHIPFI